VDTGQIVVKPYSYPYIFGFGIRSDSVRIRIRNQSLLVTNTDRIRSEYGSVADKYFVESLFEIKIGLTSGVKLACKNSSTNQQ
jgi:hypothetical protein